MDVKGFALYLKKGGRSPSAINRCMNYVSEFEIFLKESRNGKEIDNANADDLIEFADMLDLNTKLKAKGYLWAIRYYYDYISNGEISGLAGLLREERIVRKPFELKKIRGVDQDQVLKLSECGIKNVTQMLEVGAIPDDRKRIAEETKTPQSVILEFVKLSDLARIPGVKGVRARLYYDAGIDTVEKIAALDPEELRTIVIQFIEESGFEGVSTTPSEAKYTVNKARKLPKIIEY